MIGPGSHSLKEEEPEVTLTTYTASPIVHASSLQGLEKDCGILANSRHQPIYPQSTFGHTGATYPSEPHLLEEVDLSQSHRDCASHPEAATAQPVMRSRGGVDGSAVVPHAHWVPTFKREVLL